MNVHNNRLIGNFLVRLQYITAKGSYLLVILCGYDALVSTMYHIMSVKAVEHQNTILLRVLRILYVPLPLFMCVTNIICLLEYMLIYYVVL
jgi:hypothetical protein